MPPARIVRIIMCLVFCAGITACAQPSPAPLPSVTAPEASLPASPTPSVPTPTPSVPTPTPTLTQSPAPSLTPTSLPSSTPIPTPTASPTLVLPASIKFNIDPGVSEADQAAIRQGIAIASHFLETELGGDAAAHLAKLPVGVFHSTSNMGCCVSTTRNNSGGNDPSIRFYTLHPSWTARWGLFPGGIQLQHQKTAAHEYAHNWQAALGCLAGTIGQPLGHWLTEGMAEYIAFNAMVQAGQYSIKQVATFQAGVEPRLAHADIQSAFEAWEQPDAPFQPGGYNYSYFAVEKLVADNGGPLVLRRLCEEAARVARTINVRDYLHLAIAMKNLGIDRKGFYSTLPDYFDKLLGQ